MLSASYEDLASTYLHQVVTNELLEVRHNCVLSKPWAAFRGFAGSFDARSVRQQRT